MADRIGAMPGKQSGEARSQVVVNDRTRFDDGCQIRQGQSGLGVGEPPEHSGVQGIVLAGVHSWAGDGFDGLMSRPLLPIAGRPLIRHAMDWLRGSGFVQVCVCGNSDTRLLRRSLGDGRALKMAVEYVEDVMPRGPAGCARDAAIGRGAEILIVVEGTILPQIDLPALLEAHTQSRAALTVVAASGKTHGHSNGALRPMGIYVFSARVLDMVPAGCYQDI